MTTEMPNVAKTGKYSVQQTAEKLGVSRQTIYEHSEQGLIKYKYRQNGRRVYLGSEIIRYWNETL